MGQSRLKIMAVVSLWSLTQSIPNRSTLEIVMTTLGAGGKFGGEGYKQGSSGLHGVGVSAVNALAADCRVEVKRGGKLYAQEYHFGKPVNLVKVIGSATGTGTKTKFLPDLTIMETGDFQFETLAQRFREYAYLNRGLTIKWWMSAKAANRSAPSISTAASSHSFAI